MSEARRFSGADRWFGAPNSRTAFAWVRWGFALLGGLCSVGAATMFLVGFLSGDGSGWTGPLGVSTSRVAFLISLPLAGICFLRAYRYGRRAIRLSLVYRAEAENLKASFALWTHCIPWTALRSMVRTRRGGLRLEYVDGGEAGVLWIDPGVEEVDQLCETILVAAASLRESFEAPTRAAPCPGNGQRMLWDVLFVAMALPIAWLGFSTGVGSPGANEPTALGSLRTIHSAQELYRERNPDGSSPGRYAPGLAELGEATLIDSVLSSGEKSGYRFTMTSDGDSWAAWAEPLEAEEFHFYVDQSGVIRYASGEKADAGSPSVR